jgi:N-acetylglucosamine kinase-like BadF-type ATPase
MILIADSGSTKTEWVLLENNIVIKNFISDGFNPYFQSEKDVELNIKKQILPELNLIDIKGIEFIFFYGAGCSNPQNNHIIKSPLSNVFKNAKIEIEHDLLAAARACCGKEDGIACILGTGSNSCLFVKGSIKEQIPSLGLFLGDEGSGGHIGKLFISKYFYRDFSIETQKKIDFELNLNKDEVLENVYKKPFPSRYLASFTRYIGTNINNPEFQLLVEESFNDFIDKVILKYPINYTINTVGSVAYVFNKLFIKALNKHQLKFGKSIQSPIDGLIEFHQYV